MKKGLVTIVLPIYNVEKYLNRCIYSVINQSYTNIEIILVDDGSKDNCPAICDEWAKKDSRIKVIHKKNAGLGMARNTGIENANGEFIYFLDSDDFIENNTIEKCYNLAHKENAEIVIFGFNNVSSDEKIQKSTIPNPKKLIYEDKEILDSFLPNLIGPNTKTGEITNLWMSAWASFYSMDLIHQTKWKFVSEREIISEDIFSLLSLYKNVKKVAILTEPLYYYCENDTSLTHTYRKDRYERIKYFYDACQEEASKLGYSQEIKDRLAYPYISNVIAALKMIVNANCSKSEKIESSKLILNDKHLLNVVKSKNYTKEKITRKILLLTFKYKMNMLSLILIRLKS